MPDIYSLGEIDDSDFITALAVAGGQPAYIGRALGLLASFPSASGAAAWIATHMKEFLVNLMDAIHDDFGPTEEFMAELEYAENAAFGMVDEAHYIEFNRFDSLGRLMLLIIIKFVIDSGAARLLITLGAGWMKALAIDREFKQLSEKLDEIAARQSIESDHTASPRIKGVSEMNMRIGNMEKYLHFLGDAMRLDTRKYNEELTQRSGQTTRDRITTPEWQIGRAHV